MSVLDFEAYKNNKELKYVSGSLATKKKNRIEQMAEEVRREQEELDSIALVMEMSTDELIGELTIRNATGHSIREVDSKHLIEELSQRAIAIEYILMMAVANDVDGGD